MPRSRVFAMTKFLSHRHLKRLMICKWIRTMMQDVNTTARCTLPFINCMGRKASMMARERTPVIRAPELLRACSWLW